MLLDLSKILGNTLCIVDLSMLHSVVTLICMRTHTNIINSPIHVHTLIRTCIYILSHSHTTHTRALTAIIIIADTRNSRQRIRCRSLYVLARSLRISLFFVRKHHFRSFCVDRYFLSSVCQVALFGSARCSVLDWAAVCCRVMRL